YKFAAQQIDSGMSLRSGRSRARSSDRAPGTGIHAAAPAAPRIREARREDLAQLIAIEAQAFSTDRMTRRAFAYAIESPAQTVLTIARGQEALGYAIVGFRRDSHIARLTSIAVRRDVAGAGFGRALLRAA